MILPGQAQAWHPTYGGAKCEDTVLLHSDGTLETVTPPGTWPTRSVKSGDQLFDIPWVLVREPGA